MRILAAAIAAAALGACGEPEGQPSVTPSAVVIPSLTEAPTPVLTTVPEETVAVPAPTPTPEPQTNYIGQAVCTAEESVNIRTEADADAAILGKLPAGKTADVIAYDGNWANISYGGMTGYVSRDYLIARHTPDTAVPSGSWALILVNRQSLLPEGFAAEVADFEGGQVDARILAICKAMFADAEEDGVDFKLVDAYRSYELQSSLYEEKVQSYIDKGYSREDAEAEAATITARPNTSEHQTGLALDIVTPSYTKRNKGFAKTDAFKWLWANAADYGFTLRYPDGKKDLTGVIYEPWHWRFVGVDAARAMKQSGDCLEEYLG